MYKRIKRMERFNKMTTLAYKLSLISQFQSDGYEYTVKYLTEEYTEFVKGLKNLNEDELEKFRKILLEELYAFRF